LATLKLVRSGEPTTSARVPVTTTSVGRPAGGGVPAGGGAGAWAHAGAASAAARARIEQWIGQVLDRMEWCL
jgi:hypothetical protein